MLTPPCCLHVHEAAQLALHVGAPKHAALFVVQHVASGHSMLQSKPGVKSSANPTVAVNMLIDSNSEPVINAIEERKLDRKFRNYSLESWFQVILGNLEQN